jgi:hypothetical protein
MSFLNMVMCRLKAIYLKRKTNKAFSLQKAKREGNIPDLLDSNDF